MNHDVSLPVRDKGCPAAAQLEAFSAGDLVALAPHVEGCAECGRYVRALTANAEAFQKARPPELFLRQVAQRPARQAPFRWWPALLPAALAVGLGMLFIPKLFATPEAVRFKGGAFRAFVKRGHTEPAPVRMDQTLAAGDELRFAFQANRDGYLAVFELDGTERVELRFPPAPGASRITAGTTLLPGAIALDASVGPEWFVSVFSTEPLDVETLSEQLKGQSRHPRINLDCERCDIETLRIAKAAR